MRRRVSAKPLDVMTMQLLRDITAVIVAVLVSALLMSTSGWFLVRSDDYRMVLRAYHEYESGDRPTADTVEHSFAAMDRQFRQIKWIISPVIVFLAGLTASIIGSRAKVLLGILGAAPYAILMTATSLAVEYGLLGLYLVIGALGTVVPMLKRIIRTSNQGVQRDSGSASASDA